MTELAALNVRITGDSGDLTAAVNSAKTQLGGLNTTITQTKANAAGMGGALSGLATRMQGAGGKIGGIAMQLQDMAVQASMGTSAMIILGQQGSQVASAFGPLGAAFGAVLAVAPLLAVAFMDNANNASALGKAMDELTAATEAFRISAQAIRLGVDEREVLIVEELARAVAKVTAEEQRLAANRGTQAAVDAAKAEVALIQARLDGYRRMRDEELALKTAKDLSKQASDRLLAIMRQLENSDISGPWRTVLGSIQAAIEKAKEYARSSMQYSGRGGDPRQFGANAGQTGTFNVENFAVPGAGGGGGGGAAVNPLQTELETLQQSLMTQEQLQMESYARQQETLNNALQQRLISQQEYAALMEQVEKTHQFAMTKETNAGVQATLGHLGQLFQGSKKIGAAIALANSWLAFTEVLKDPSLPWFAKIPKAAAVLASGLNAVRNIKSASPGGSTGGAGAGAGGGAPVSSAPQTSTQVALQLVGGDLFSRDQVIKLINSINDATSDGARIILR